MKKIIIFEPAMCCSTGLCGAMINPELLRISTIINNLEKRKIKIERYNLSSNPDMFVKYEIINKLINEEGINVLPITIVDNVVMKKSNYPSNDEIIKWLEIEGLILNNKQKNSKCNCKGGCC